MASIKPRIRPRIYPMTHSRLLAYAQSTGKTQSEITDAALRHFFRNQDAEVQENALLRRLDHTTGQLGRVDRDVRLLTDAFTLYLQYFFTVIPDISPSQSDARAAQGVKHFHDFLDRYRDFVKSGGANIKNAVEDLLVTDQSFFSDEDIEKLKENARDGGET